MLHKATDHQASGVVAYYRVSTDKQGRSGLGLEAQRAAVHEYARRQGLEVVQEFTEVQSGRRGKKRPEYLAALAATRQLRGVLVVAKLDRLGRSVTDITALLDSGVPFVIVDQPEADRTTLQIMAVIAEQEARLISERTRAALAAHKARGGKLGTPDNLTPAIREESNRQRQERARKRNQPATALAVSMRSSGSTYQAIADELTRSNFETAKGGRWTPTAVRRLLVREGKQASVPRGTE